MITSRVVAKLSLLPIYICSVCKTSCNGTTVNMEIDCVNIDDLARMVNRTQSKSYDMPYGWSYDGAFTCNLCLKGERK